MGKLVPKGVTTIMIKFSEMRTRGPLGDIKPGGILSGPGQGGDAVLATKEILDLLTRNL